ncbi:hypothetical protein FQA39_LY15389 [Lamprigera yunnana]|nr:hypothetical protein FQA39_LY15389 [Lamprigera yunnana]
MLLVLLTGLFAVLFYFKVVKKYNFWHDRGVPYIKPIYFIGNFGATIFRIKSIHQILKDAYNKYPNSRYVGFYQASEPVLILRDPDLIKDVTIKEFDSFPNHKKFLPPNVDLLWERNLLQMSNKYSEEGWHTMRATLSPSFTSSKMKMLFNLMRDCSTEFVKYFQSQKGEIVVELKDTFTRFTNDIIATSAFGIQCNSLKDRNNKFYLMGKEATDFSGLRGLTFFGYEFSPLLMKLFKIKIFSEKVSNFFKGVIKETVTHRQQNNIVRPDMLHLLLEASKKLKNLGEDKKSNNMITEFSLVDITAQALIFFTAGFDTVSSTMCYLAYELSTHPEIQDKLYNEIKETLKDTPQLTYESITAMKYLECCISEKQIRMEKGQMVWIPICGLHHDEKYFPNPLKFDPERFNDENRPEINPFVYVPFGTGPRMCIGKTANNRQTETEMLFNLMRDCSTEFVKYFQSQKGEIVVELKDTFTRFTNDIIATSAFGIQCNSLKDRNNKFYLMGKEATDFSGLRGLTFFGYEFSPLLMKLFKIKIFSEKVSNFFKGVIKETVTHRQQNNIVRPDMLHLLLEASKKLKNLGEDKKSNNMITEFSLVDITAQALIFFTAGFDTVSSTMCYLAYELSTHPEIQDKLYNEIKETLKDTPQLTYESITAMKYLECCISESLRVHPPVPVFDRQCQKSYTINPIHPSEKQIRMEKGQMVWIPICGLHHDEKYFPNPLKFDPERFNDENRPEINPFVYVPFGTGPRMCIGSRFAIMEIKLILVEILRHFEIVVNKQTKIPLNYSVTNFNGIPDDESLRVTPAVPISDRMCQKPYTIEPVTPTEKPVRLDKSTIIWISIGAFHKDEKYFPNPNKFDPKRFSDENKRNINPNAYIPFGIGPRSCITILFGDEGVAIFRCLTSSSDAMMHNTLIPFYLFQTNPKPQVIIEVTTMSVVLSVSKEKNDSKRSLFGFTFEMLLLLICKYY